MINSIKRSWNVIILCYFVGITWFH